MAQGNDVKNHDRLDLVQTSEEFTAAVCGSVNAKTGKPDYCAFDCPTLKQTAA